MHPERTENVEALEAGSRRASSAFSLVLAALLCALTSGSSMPAFDGATQWIGTPPLSPAQLRGKIVLVDFWEYTCLNCLRTLPYLREWNKRYGSDGLVIVGVQTPEFSFSGEASQVSGAMKRLGIDWPVALDDRRAIWNRYGINEWPTEMLFDQQGRLVETQIGEGNYPQTERNIQALIRVDRKGAALPQPMALLPEDSYDKPGAVCYPHTPEVLIENTPVADAPRFGNPAEDIEYADRSAHKDGGVYLDGYWHATKEALVFGGGSGYFLMPYRAIEVTAVLTPGHGTTRANILQDDKPLARDDAGADVRYDSSGTSYVNVDTSRAYRIVMNKTYGAHELKLVPQGAGVAVYDVAFESCEIPSK
ncbi:MAG: redoxin family protein [Candidatus Eremiobacteraeota bacterium]|nr:redoxin family protein [Candidatus Eremiobacteraeota bacterium]